MLSPEEFFDYYEKNLRQYELGGWHLVRKPLSGDTGTFYMAIYQFVDGKWRWEETKERSSDSYRWEYDTWEELYPEMIRTILVTLSSDLGPERTKQAWADLGFPR